MKHAEVERNLYDFIAGELGDAERASVERHLSECARCSAHCEDLRRSMERLTRAMADPASGRTDEYWQGFARGVESKLQSAVRSSRAARPPVWEQIGSFFLVHRAPAIAAGVACVLLLAAVLYRGEFFTAKQSDPVASASSAELSSPDSLRVVPAAERMERYLRKSKILLVGLSNMKTDADHPLDLSAEREASRSLIKEARFLQTQDIDRRSARLISALNKILIELANLEDENDVPGVEIIRGGIDQENLLFKIRMAEALNDSTAGNVNRSF